MWLNVRLVSSLWHRPRRGRDQQTVFLNLKGILIQYEGVIQLRAAITTHDISSPSQSSAGCVARLWELTKISWHLSQRYVRLLKSSHHRNAPA